MDKVSMNVPKAHNKAGVSAGKLLAVSGKCEVEAFTVKNTN